MRGTNHPDDKKQHPCKSLLVHFLLTEQFLLCKSGGGGGGVWLIIEVRIYLCKNLEVKGGGGVIFKGDLFSGNIVYTGKGRHQTHTHVHP